MTYMYVKNLGKAEKLQRCVKKDIYNYLSFLFSALP